jgi:7-carboxy-7-deazaguanine synthase
VNRERGDALRINEIFFSIQGESSHAGRPCVFVRLTCCNLRCSYCDTEYAFFEGDFRSFDQIFEEIETYDCRLVEITGGEPLVQKNVIPFMTMLCDKGYEVLIETGGHMDISLIDSRVVRIMDIKCPGSGESEKVRWENIGHLRPTDEVKFVIADRADYDWARGVIDEYQLNQKCTVLFSPVFGRMDNVTLVEWILEDRLYVRFQLQMHKYIWHPAKRGV